MKKFENISTSNFVIPKDLKKLDLKRSISLLYPKVVIALSKTGLTHPALYCVFWVLPCYFCFSTHIFNGGGKSSSVLRFFPNSAKTPLCTTPLTQSPCSAFILHTEMGIISKVKMGLRSKGNKIYNFRTEIRSKGNKI